MCLVGLEQAAHLNGTFGTVLARQPGGSDRWQVFLDCGMAKAIRATNLVAWFDLLDLPPPPVTSCPLSQDKLYSFLVGVGLLGLSCLCVGLRQLCRRSQRREIKASTAPSLGGYDVAPNQAVLAGRELQSSGY